MHEQQSVQEFPLSRIATFDVGVLSRRTLDEIEQDLKQFSGQQVDGSRDYELGRRRSSVFTALYYRLPGFLRVAAMRSVLRNPDRRKAMMGTVVVTSLAPGMKFPGWIVPTSMHNLAFGLGLLSASPASFPGRSSRGTCFT